MTSAQLFDLANLYILPFWTIMILFPKWNITKKVMGSYIPFLPLIAAYIYYLIVTVDPESAAALANPQLADIARFFSEEGAAGAGWVHFLVMDLFVGRWIYWQGQNKQIWTIHSLILCLFFGPVGLLSHIITETIFDKKSDAEKSVTDTVVS
ncbi:MAG: ABA4-like family protein [Pleurocapsa sp. MO_192.B19]|nr:ABA4-like family protein [Pleurocapsa sp. MO_192.B19]